jgi:hypothetical protein
LRGGSTPVSAVCRRGDGAAVGSESLTLPRSCFTSVRHRGLDSACPVAGLATRRKNNARTALRARSARGGKPFEGAVVFDLRELAEWAARWVPALAAVTYVDCGACGRPGVRLAKEGEAVHCQTCKLQ